MSDPKKGDVIQGTGGLRKIRVAGKDKGKRGGSRVIYYFLDNLQRFYLLTIYSKNEISDLSADQKKQLKAFLITIMLQPLRTILRASCSGGFNHGQEQDSVSKKHEYSCLY